MKKYLPISLIFITSIIFYLPILIHPNLLLSRNNDLQQQFWPVFYYVRENFLKFHQIPLWNNLFFAGTPLLPDPQFSPVYPANLLFLILPTSVAFLIFFLIHTIIASVTSYILARHGFDFSASTSVFFSLLYISTPKLAGYLEAGHYGLFATHAWIPLTIYAVIKLSEKPNIKKAILLGISFSGLYFTHTIIFLLSAFSSIILFIILVILSKKNNISKKVLFFIIASLIGFGLSAITLLPQLSWGPTTTRNLLSIHPDIYPTWNSTREFFSNLFLFNHSQISTIDEEKWITIGSFVLLFSIIGFTYLSKKLKLVIGTVLFASFVFMINNLSPLYSNLLYTNWYQLIRVTTRLWFIPGTILLALAALGFEKLTQKTKKPIKILIFGIALLAIFESLYISESRITKKPILQNLYIKNDLLIFFQEDHDQYRIFCTTRCVSQQQAALNNLELVEGYNTLQQINYYKITNQMMGGRWNYYTLPIPPSGIGKLTPDPNLLGEYNVKYIISPYKLGNNSFIFLNTYNNNFYLYKNSLYQQRSNQEIMTYSPNFIKVDIVNPNSNLILRDIYNSGWNAYANGKTKIEIKENKNSQREVNFPSNTKFLNFIYEPENLRIGVIITVITIFFVILSF